MKTCDNCGDDITHRRRHRNYNPLDTREYCDDCSHLAGPHVEVVIKDEFHIKEDIILSDIPQVFLEPAELHEQIADLQDEVIQKNDDIAKLDADVHNANKLIDRKNEDITRLAARNEKLLLELEVLEDYSHSEEYLKRDLTNALYALEVLKEILRR